MIDMMQAAKHGLPDDRADVHKSQVIYVADPWPRVPEPKDGRGRPTQQLQAQTTGIRVDAWLAQQPVEAWQRLTLRDSTRGELRVEALSQRVWLWDGEEMAAHCWHLIVRREIGSRDTIKFTLSINSRYVFLTSVQRVRRLPSSDGRCS
jgi:hypothetical protein